LSREEAATTLVRHAVTSKRLNRFFLQILKITNFPPK
jgi:hypothetical protein